MSAAENLRRPGYKPNRHPVATLKGDRAAAPTIGCLVPHSAGETRLGFSLHAEPLDREQTATVVSRLHIEHLLADRGRVHHVQIVPAEHEAGDDRYRHLDVARNRTIRVVADDLSATRDRRPVVTFRIDRGAIRHPAEPLDGREQALVGNRAGREVVVVGRNRPGDAVGAVERAIVGAEAWTVGACDRGFEYCVTERRIQAEDRADRLAEFGIQGASDKSAARVSLAVVESGSRLGNRTAYLLGLSRLEIEKIKAVGERAHGAAL